MGSHPADEFNHPAYTLETWTMRVFRDAVFPLGLGLALIYTTLQLVHLPTLTTVILTLLGVATASQFFYAPWKWRKRGIIKFKLSKRGKQPIVEISDTTSKRKTAQA